MIDESHRLKMMPTGYDVVLFNQIYKETKDLRKKLAFNIDSRKFGVDYHEVLSWFDVKFIHTFNRYYFVCTPGELKGRIIRSLQTYKTRIIKNSYLDKNSVHQTSDIDEVYSTDIADEEFKETTKDLLIERLKGYFRDRLSLDAYLLWEFDNFPPAYILQKKEKSTSKLLDDDVIDFFDLPLSSESYEYIKVLRKEVKEITKRAKEYFQYKGTQY